MDRDDLIIKLKSLLMDVIGVESYSIEFNEDLRKRNSWDIGCEKDFVITGGQSKNRGIVTRVEEILGIKSLPMLKWGETGLDPVVAGGIGAALFAKALYEKS